MKKLILILGLISFIQISQSEAQKVYFWLDVGLKVDAGTGMHINKALLDDFESTAQFGNMYGIGGKFGFNFGEFHGFTIDAMFHQYNQKNNLRILEENQEKRFSYNAIDFYGMYRYTRNLNYIEVGAKYSILSKYTQTVGAGTTEMVDPLFVDNQISPVLGIGFLIAGSDAFTTILGFRLAYGLNDIVSEAGMQSNAFVAPANLDYAETNPAFIEFVLEFNFGLGYYAKATCGKRAKFFGN